VPGADTTSEREFVQAFARGLEVIKTFGTDSAEMTLAEVARRANVSRATARRSLQTLEALGYADTDGSKWRLRPRLLEVGYAYLASVPKWGLIQEHIQELTLSLGQPATVAVLDHHDIVYVASAAVPGLMTMAMTIGTRLPAYTTAAGRQLLAGLPEAELERYLKEVRLERFTERTVLDKKELARSIALARESGSCVVDREMWPNIRAAAVPLHDAQRNVVGALQMCCHAGDVSMSVMKGRIVRSLQAASEQVDRDLAVFR
jgi:IclR family transcriptional regulator, pca regulon regulatory protein